METNDTHEPLHAGAINGVGYCLRPESIAIIMAGANISGYGYDYMNEDHAQHEERSDGSATDTLDNDALSCSSMDMIE